MFKHSFLFEGRIRRLEYILSEIIFCIASCILEEFMKDGIIPILLFIPMFWFILAQGTKRCHDLGNSGWFQLIPFYIFWMLFAKSNCGDNKYGANPKEGNVTVENDRNTGNNLLGYPEMLNEAITKQSFFKKYIKPLNKSTKIVFIAAGILLIYGFICRMGIYFFWESKEVGILLLMLGICMFLSQQIKNKKKLNKNTIGEKIAIGFICFILAADIWAIALAANFDLYTIAKSSLLNNDELINEIGGIKGFSVVQIHSISITTWKNKDSGSADINLIVNGAKKYEDIQLYMSKNYDSSWKIIIAR